MSEESTQLERKMSAAEAIQKQAIDLDAAMKQIEEIKPALARLMEVSQSVHSVYDTIIDTISQVATTARLAHFKQEEIQPWLKHVWSKYQTPKRDEFVIGLPRFVTFSVGWWDHSDEGYNYFKVNRFTDWLAEVPLDIRKELGLRKPEPLTIESGMLVAKGPVSKEAWERYKPFLAEKVKEGAYKIKPRLNYPLAIQLVKDGILPYSPNPFPKELIQEQKANFEPEAWQQDARMAFRKYSNLGIFAPPGTGKTFGALRILCDVKPDPPHLIVMKERRLVIQWIERIKALTPLILDKDVVVETFSTALTKRLFEKPWSLLVIDECQDLPADGFSRMAYVNCKGRIGLTASPFREDGRTELIFALTGYPFPIPWQEAMRLKGITPPTINVWFVKDFQGKITKTRELLAEAPGLKTFIYCDHIEPGKTIAKVLDAPFVFGEGNPQESLKILRENPTVVVSRVGDRGLSFADIERIIEVDFLYGSRQQALQRTGRLLHSELKTVHHILMTPNEYEKYRKRLMAYEGKGLRLEFPNRREYQEKVGKRSAVAPSMRSTTRTTTRSSVAVESVQAPMLPSTLKETMPGLENKLAKMQQNGDLTPLDVNVVKTLAKNKGTTYTYQTLSNVTGTATNTIVRHVNWPRLVKEGFVRRPGKGQVTSAL